MGLTDHTGDSDRSEWPYKGFWKTCQKLGKTSFGEGGGINELIREVIMSTEQLCVLKPDWSTLPVMSNQRSNFSGLCDPD